MKFTTLLCVFSLSLFYSYNSYSDENSETSSELSSESSEDTPISFVEDIPELDPTEVVIAEASQKKEEIEVESEKEVEVKAELEKEEIVEELAIPESSMGLEWKDSYTEALVEVFEHRDIQPIFDVTIHHEDLEKIGCVNYNELSKIEKMKFLVVYMSAIAEAESDYRTHITTLNPGDRTINVGMLQIDVNAARNHTKRALGEVSKDKLKDPHFNLKVGVFVFKNQVLGKIARGRFFPKRSYYWQVLTYPKRLLKTMDKNRENINFCREE